MNHYIKAAAIAGGLLLSVSLLCSQQAGGYSAPAKAGKPAFEVFSFRHSGTLAPGRLPRGYPTELLKAGRVSCEEELGVLVREAWRLRKTQYSAPPWVESEYYNLEARLPAGTSRASLDLMLQSALEERLELRYHLEDRETPIYALLVAKGGVKLPLAGKSKPTAIPAAKQGIQLSGYHADSITLDFLAGGFLSHNLDRPVIDMTGLTGTYSVDLDWSGGSEGGPGGRGIDTSSISDALRRVGLRLEPRKQTEPFLVIDHINKEPAAN